MSFIRKLGNFNLRFSNSTSSLILCRNFRRISIGDCREEFVRNITKFGDSVEIYKWSFELLAF